MKRRYIPLEVALKEAREVNPFLTEEDGIMACYECEDMGWCKDRVTRWYKFDDVNGNPAYTLKR